jgi:hypothetical protein
LKPSPVSRQAYLGGKGAIAPLARSLVAGAILVESKSITTAILRLQKEHITRMPIAARPAEPGSRSPIRLPERSIPYEELSVPRRCNFPFGLPILPEADLSIW